jgi:hypothetical protein
MSSILKLQYRNLPVWERGVIKQKKVTTGYKSKKSKAILVTGREGL